jgi:hypothetical protein
MLTVTVSIASGLDVCNKQGVGPLFTNHAPRPFHRSTGKDLRRGAGRTEGGPEDRPLDLVDLPSVARSGVVCAFDLLWAGGPR